MEPGYIAARTSCCHYMYQRHGLTDQKCARPGTTDLKIGNRKVAVLDQGAVAEADGERVPPFVHENHVALQRFRAEEKPAKFVEREYTTPLQ